MKGLSATPAPKVKSASLSTSYGISIAFNSPNLSVASISISVEKPAIGLSNFP